MHPITIATLLLVAMATVAQGGNSHFFQYANVPAWNAYEFGYNRGNQHHFTSRFEKAHGWTFKTKVRVLEWSAGETSTGGASPTGTITMVTRRKKEEKKRGGATTTDPPRTSKNRRSSPETITSRVPNNYKENPNKYKPSPVPPTDHAPCAPSIAPPPPTPHGIQIT
ncbi:hypothetical protein Fcan01_23490 [Folsomia candida]|uniref:Uncharacterized protein n=1 Tax=Folsomia candida TaxID=158441 RepID=A0A226D915_FOLCA|nr:hypothetical protein Fcan01_23490 [Folsomia candida]